MSEKKLQGGRGVCRTVAPVPDSDTLSREGVAKLFRARRVGTPFEVRIRADGMREVILKPDEAATGRMMRSAKLALQAFVDPAKAFRWLSAPDRVSGRVPVELATESAEGARMVAEELYRIGYARRAE